MPCCHIPNAIPPNWPDRLSPDAQRFAKYVGGASLEEVGEPPPVGTLTSALHLEMKLWEPTPFNWYVNDAQRNSWGVMANRTTAPQSEYPRFDKPAQDGIFSDIKVPASRLPCRLKEFDSWQLSKLVELRNAGLANSGLNSWHYNGNNKPPELATFGLAQKLVNIFNKYELCWQVAGQWVNHLMEDYHEVAIPNLPGYLCALHAPIDRILLAGPPKEKGLPKTNFGLYGTPLGTWLNDKNMIRSSGDLMQSSDGQFRPWSKLDCLRTYYGLQLMLRRIAMETWLKNCACDPSTAATIVKCANWFNTTYGREHPCGQNQPDWIQAACDLPEDVCLQTLQGLRPQQTGQPHIRFASGKESEREKRRVRGRSPENTIPKADQQLAKFASKIANATPNMNKANDKPKTLLYLCQIHEHDTAITFKEKCDARWNLGWCCWAHGVLDLKVKKSRGNTRYLIGEIMESGGNFTAERGYSEDHAPETHCLGGVEYEGGVKFGSVEKAVKYLKQYFEIQACPDNPVCTQTWIDNV